MLELGADSFWYWNIGAFCFSGDETALSVSGREYQTPDRLIAENDIITIDLSPQRENIWGDYARTILVEEGQVVPSMTLIKNPVWKQGLQMEQQLHTELLRIVDSSTTFEGLYYHMNQYILQHGFCNLDFMGNLGHSIVKNKANRIYIERGNTKKLSEAHLFTFEPHIGKKDSKWGYKQEDIYYFDNGFLKVL